VSMSAWILHRDPKAWESPDTFDPTRWLDASKRAFLEKRMVSFGRGSRACLGQNLAMCEMFVVVGTIFRKFENLQTYNVTAADMEMVDHFSAFRKKKAARFQVIEPLTA
jgi:cytochrome P450